MDTRGVATRDVVIRVSDVAMSQAFVTSNLGGAPPLESRSRGEHEHVPGRSPGEDKLIPGEAREKTGKSREKPREKTNNSKTLCFLCFFRETQDFPSKPPGDEK